MTRVTVDVNLDAKRSKASVSYSRGMRSSHCAICRHFEAPDACSEVAGSIDPAFWCELFERKA